MDSDLHVLFLMTAVNRKVGDGGVVEKVEFAFAAVFEEGAFPVGFFVTSLVQAVAMSFPDGVGLASLSRDERDWFSTI